MAVKGGRRPSGDDEIMTPGLPPDSRADRLPEWAVGGGEAKRLSQIDRIILAETHIERARAGDAHPIAAFAEIVRKRGDKSEAPSRFPNVVIARRAAGGVSRRNQGQRFLQAGA